jgi:hypothetical protein
MELCSLLESPSTNSFNLLQRELVIGSIVKLCRTRLSRSVTSPYCFAR